MTDTTDIVPPAGASTYSDALGNTQWRVDGPRGRLLVTRSKGGTFVEVWRPDSLGTIRTHRSLQHALDYAHWWLHRA